MTDRERCGELRRAHIRARSSLDKVTRGSLSHRITEQIMDSPPFRAARTVMIYRAVGGEVCLDGLMGTDKRLVYPLCVSDTEMVALLPDGSDAWTAGFHGIPEPVRDRSTLILPHEIDMIICPCTVFDRQCRRMGMGAGFYDRYLPQCSRAFVAAAAFECQRADRIPVRPWDVPMDAVFTEKAVYLPASDRSHSEKWCLR